MIRAMETAPATDRSTGSPLAILNGLIRSMRPRQAPKNGLVLVALFFTVNKWWDVDQVGGMARLVLTSAAATFVFIIVSGVVYIVNDLIDAERDRAHPRKRFRPIAAGIVPIKLAWVVAVLLLIGSLAGAFAISTSFGLISLGYFALQQGYNAFLKNAVILDVATVAAGFVLRAVAGSEAINGFKFGSGADHVELELTISPWLYVCTASGALLIALIKRRAELVTAGDNAANQRPILGEYSVELIDRMVAVVAPVTLMAYTLYSFSGSFLEDVNLPDNNSMMLTVPFVAYGLFRYLYLGYRGDKGEAPEELLFRDPALLVTIVLWLTTAALVLRLN
ncbi:MAG: decaprenyl-phosphate phosphoribosyltransferase [Chloroflexi bacterium]|jgi:4-hydroxybenzoate polyprenyltransferase|nr:decaprenyl-phosphate phosphoribosyltransferase [Chloroflexota bacterium]MBT4073907.1 decaprenyl-phosphate phosphoribosyltransferase [Chloroflexota bacterium]MBT5319437.1 decaprenyl-phosphate phosphoribosyltransferase [Chloroflexota bacterium]MBT6683152.1 decaprenyl-phosphate phosphoribosyltransferase [Chloroflexota bacterium]